MPPSTHLIFFPSSVWRSSHLSNLLATSPLSMTVVAKPRSMSDRKTRHPTLGIQGSDSNRARSLLFRIQVVSLLAQRLGVHIQIPEIGSRTLTPRYEELIVTNKSKMLIV